MKSKFILSSCLLLMMTLIGCSGTTTTPSQETSSPSAKPTTPQAVTTSSPSAKPVTPSSVTPRANSSLIASNPSSSPVAETLKISPAGIGTVKLGMTLGQLKKELGSKAEFKVKSPFMVDFDAIAVSKSGKVQYYILYPAGKPLADSDKITALLTDNPDYRTDKGVGPGTPLKQAATVYGDATLSYNTALEGREYVNFANQPAKNISFRLGSAGDNSLAGIYPSTSGEYNQTKQYKDTASIQAVRVDCRVQSCAKP